MDGLPELVEATELLPVPRGREASGVDHGFGALLIPLHGGRAFHPNTAASLRRGHDLLDLLDAEPPGPAQPVPPIADALNVDPKQVGHTLLRQAGFQACLLQPAAEGRRVDFRQYGQGEAYSPSSRCPREKPAAGQEVARVGVRAQ